jgi:hypothetical protein
MVSSSHDLVDGRFETNTPTQNLAQDAIAAFARLITWSADSPRLELVHISAFPHGKVLNLTALSCALYNISNCHICCPQDTRMVHHNT